MPALTDGETLALFRGERVELDSTCLAWARYDAESGALAVQYRGGAVYRYQITLAELADFAAADSKGRWANQVLKDGRAFGRAG